jgi:hypothetical protein
LGIIELRLKSDKILEKTEDRLVSIDFCYKSKRNYSIMAVGLDYNYVLNYGAYRQALYQSVIRAHDLECDKLYLGMDASIEKRKFGAQIKPQSVYIQANDNFNMELIGTVYNKK